MNTQLATTDTAPVRWVRPLFDLYESDDAWLLVADLPGVTAQQLEVSLDRRELVFEARSDGTTGFRRSFTVPDGVADVDATLVNGTLRVRLDKPQEQVPRRIEVKSA